MIDIVSRSEWGAKPPRSTPVPMRNKRSSAVVIHHTGGSESGAAGMRAIQAYHMSPTGRDWSDIAYNFTIDGDTGVIYEGRGFGIRGGHSLGDVNELHGICVMGNFENEPLKAVAKNALTAFVREGSAEWWNIALLGHRDTPGANTPCPGRNLYTQLPAIQAAALISSTPPTPLEDEEMFLYSTTGKPVFFCDGGKSVGLNEQTDMETFNTQKVRHFVLDDDTFAKFREAFPGA